MNDNLQLSARVAFTTISTANSNIDGTGSMGTLINGQENGTIIKSITIKALGATSQGMIRFFISSSSGGTRHLLKEIRVPASAECNVNSLFSKVVGWPLINFRLPNDHYLYVSTEEADTFNIIADGMTWSYFQNNGTLQEIADVRIATINTANPNVDGSGAMSLVTDCGMHGLNIRSLTIKSTGNTSPGMVRLFIDDGETKVLFKEVRIPGTTASATVPLFSKVVLGPMQNFKLEDGFSLYASTEVGDSFNIIAEGTAWNYPIA